MVDVKFILVPYYGIPCQVKKKEYFNKQTIKPERYYNVKEILDMSGNCGFPYFKQRTDVKKSKFRKYLDILSPLNLPNISNGITYETSNSNLIFAVGKHYQMVAYLTGEIDKLKIVVETAYFTIDENREQSEEGLKRLDIDFPIITDYDKESLDEYN